MDQNNEAILLNENELLNLRRLIVSGGVLNFSELKRRGWIEGEIDDKSIFDDDASRLADAFRAEKVDRFFVVKIADLLQTYGPVNACVFTATKEGVEEFQGPKHHEINLEDCLLFPVPISCVVFRPGEVNRTIFAGSPEFVSIVTGV